jgi:uncharacterized repeat protein (TIGR02543 family)
MGLKRKIIAVSLYLIMMLGCINVNVIDAKASSFTLSANNDNSANDGLGAVDLDWSSYSKKNVMFKGYQSKDGGKTWQTISLMDYTSVKEIKVLQIYPIENAKGQLKTWMETNGYGKGIIKVDSVYIDDFNNNPNAYLSKTNGKWNYDVLFLGTWDSNNSKDLSAASKSLTESYINDGGGCIFGHDTIRWDTYNTAGALPNFTSLAKYVNITQNSYWAEGKSNASTSVKIIKKGLFTTYPWNIGEIGTVLKIPAAHSVGQSGNGDIWLEFVNQTAIPEGDKGNFYLTTYNNCAMIQTGHSNGAATEDEQKIIANLIFYNYQLSEATSVTDNSAMDTTAPNKPKVTEKDSKFYFSATDNGTTYKHKIEAYAKNDTNTPIDTSNITTSTVTTGIKGYRYLYDNNKDTVITSQNGTEVTSDAIPYSNEGGYLHVASVDNAGNISETTTIVSKYKNKYEHWAWGFKNEGNNSNKTAFLLQTTYGEETYGEEFTPDASYALTVPNGFYLAPRFGNGQITGKWTTFNFGTKITQPSYAMNFEYDYYPTDYTITYNLDGGTNSSSNPDSYTVLYGVKFADPSKKGYDFLGWYDANGNKLTGINEGCYATFADTEDLYNRLNKRTTGDISVTAKWKKHDYSITTNKTGSGAISNSGIVTYTNNTSVFIIPAKGYTTSSLKIDGVSVTPVTKYNFLNVEADHKVEATFTISQDRKMELMQKEYSWINLKL